MEFPKKENKQVKENKEMMNLTIETISVLNRTATEDFGKAKAMLDGINMVLGTEYEFLNKRVVFFDDTSSIARKYATAHDAMAYAKQKRYVCMVEQNKSEAITHKTLERKQNEEEDKIFFIRNISYNITNNREYFMWSGI